MNKNNITAEIKTAINVVLFDKTAMNHVMADKKKTVFGLYIIIASAVLALITQLVFMGKFLSLSFVIKGAIMQVIMAVISIYLLSLIAQKVFGGKGKHDEFFRVASYASILGWLGALGPVLAGALGAFTGGAVTMVLSLAVLIWGIVLIIKILALVHKLSGAKIAGTLIVMLIVVAIFSKLFNYGSMGRTNYSGNFEIPGGSMGNIDVMDEDNFEMTVPTDEGTGSVKMVDGKMTIQGPDGQVMEINIPDAQ
ncbi:YIP1 family protein [Candidatus Peregrinibacteria bacterium]|nr:YIP1 family protein [Candidatus Peregrinibacteria bacterium]